MIIDEAARVLRVAPEGAGIALGLSGGADSVALLRLLTQIFNRKDVTAVHVCHGIRGAEAERDAAFCGELCEWLGVPFELRRVDAKGFARSQKLSLEDAARRLRYAALGEAARAKGAAFIATAHHAEDSAETVLLNLFRGAGPAGLCGIHEARGRLIRPLLRVTRAEILGFLGGEGFIEDSSNLDDRYRRNYIRNRIMPEVRAAFGDNVCKAIAGAAELLRDEDELLDGLARAELEGIDDGGLDIERLGALHIALRRRVVRLAIERAKGDLVDVGCKQVEGCLALLEKQSGRGVDLGGGLRAARQFGRLVFEREAAALGFEYRITPGEPLFIGELGKRVTLTGDWPAGLTARTRRAGDLYHGKLMKEWLIKQKTPLAMRRRLWYIADGRDVLWVSDNVDTRNTYTVKID